MTHNEKVASYKAYLQTGDPQFIPSVYEKTAHVNEVQAWKDRWFKTAGLQEKEARAGHPANVALARALSPGILPGMNSGGSKVHVSHNGDFNHDIAGFIEGGVDPGTLSYLRGEKTAVTMGPDRRGKPPAPSKPPPTGPSKLPPTGPSNLPPTGPSTKAYIPSQRQYPLPPDDTDERSPLNMSPEEWKARWGKRVKRGGKVKQAASEQSLSLSDILRRAVGKLADPEIAKEGQHEKTALGPTLPALVAAGAEDALKHQPLKAMRDAFDYENNPAFDGTGGLSRVATNLVDKHYKPGDPEQAEFAASPITEEDLYRRYGRVPESSREKVRNRNNHWAKQPHIDYRRGVTDRVTAENRAATTKNLKLPKTPLSARLRQLAEGAFNTARYIGYPSSLMLKYPEKAKGQYDAGIPRGGNLSLPALPGRSTEEIAKEGGGLQQAYARWNIGKAQQGRDPDYASPATEDDLYRRYGRLPKYGPLGRFSRPTKAVDWEPSEYVPQRGAQRLGGGLGYAAGKIRDWFRSQLNRKDPNTLPQGQERFGNYRSEDWGSQYSPKEN